MKKFVVIELFIEQEGNISLNCAKVLLNKNDFKIDNPFYNVTSIDELPKYTHQLPVYLVIHGKGILTKDSNQLVQSKDLLSDNKFLSQTFLFKDCQLTAIARKDILDNYISILLEKNICIKNIFLGASSLLFLINKNIKSAPYIDIYGYRFSNTEEKQLKITNSSFTKNEFFINQEKEYPMQSAMIVSLITLLSDNNNFSVVTDEIEEIYNLKPNYFFNLYYKSVQKNALFLFFALLLLNFFCYMLLSKSNANDTIEKNSISLLTNKADSLRNILKEQEKTLSNDVSNSKTFFSIFTDKIMDLLPSGIKLLEYNCNPALFSRKENNYQFEQNKVIISGIAENSFLLNQWLKNLEKENLIIKSNFISYKQEQGFENGHFVLEVFFQNQWVKTAENN